MNRRFVLLLAILVFFPVMVQATGLELDGTWTNEIGMRFKLIHPGTFQMGSEKGPIEEQRAHEGPVHEVRLTRPYFIGVTEVTQAEYEQIMGENPSGWGHPERPVEQVNWDKAVEFCERLAKKDRLTYRLPTEAEWEYACRAGSTGEYSWGDWYERGAAWSSENTVGKSEPVGRLGANPWGLYDMSGNVWEWCQDRWQERYPAGNDVDPEGPSSGFSRAVRGGSYKNPGAGVRSAERMGVGYDETQPWIGFRVVRLLEEGSEEMSSLPPPPYAPPSVEPPPDSGSDSVPPPNEPIVLTVKPKKPKRYPLHELAAKGDAARLLKKLSDGAAIDELDDLGRTLLLTAIDHGQYQLAATLIDRRANPRLADQNGTTPLMAAARAGRPELVTALLARGAPVNERDLHRHTALSLARQGKQAAIEAQLCKAGAIDRTPQQLDDSLFAAIKAQNLPGVTAALGEGAGVDSRNPAGMTPLMAAAHFGSLEVARLLLEKKAIIDAVNRQNGVTALMIATLERRTEIVRLLVERKADLHLRDNNGKTAMALARDKGLADMADLLARLGAYE